MVDRFNRDRLAAIIRQYLADEITSFKFDERIFDIAKTSQDKTITHVAHLLWPHYDDCKDHKAVLTKTEWDYFQRLLLVLESDADIDSHRIWLPTQIAAALCLVAFCVVAVRLGTLDFTITAPFGLLSMAIAYWYAKMFKPTAFEEAVYPFSSIGELFAVRRSVTDFVKQQYPRHLTSRHVRSPLLVHLSWLWTVPAWLLFSPLFLFFQALPGNRVTCAIDMPH